MISKDDFAFLCKLLHERSGLALGNDKEYLLLTRLKPVLASHGLKDVASLVAQLRGGRAQRLADDVIEAMTTNESLFFRDGTPFEALTEMMLPALCAARPTSRPIRIWCAAASIGQEPYSIAIALEENAQRFHRHRFEIVASDLSRAAIARAKAGTYSAFEVSRGVPDPLLRRYFTAASRNNYTIAQKIRSRVSFQHRNLLRPFDDLGSFDIVFCRNVLIYFDRATKANVLERIAQVVPADGFLTLGGPETVLGLTSKFLRHPKWRNVYTRSPVASSPALATERACA